MGDPSSHKPTKITLIGAGTIGLSFCAFHLSYPPVHITMHDPRPDLESYLARTLPSYLASSLPSVSDLFSSGVLRLETDLQSAVRDAGIVQEQGPENLAFKSSLWCQVEAFCPASCALWSSTSGIPASKQSAGMKEPARLLVVHPYNPPHIMPLLEIVPSPATWSDSPQLIDQTVAWFKARDRKPVVLKKECTGFVANRLAFALLREAIGLVDQGIVSVEELDDIVTASMGPRWAIRGPFWG